MAAVLVPFAIWEEPITAWTEDFVAAPGNRLAAGATLGGLLAADVLAPVPSSLLSTACGYVLGLWGGMFVSWIGMTAGAIFGYWIGTRPAAALARGVLGNAEIERAREIQSRWGAWGLVVSRSVPVLAEISVVFAGVTRMRFGRFLGLVSLANLGVSAVYAWIGSRALEADAFLWAFAGAVLLPGLAMLLTKRL